MNELKTIHHIGIPAQNIKSDLVEQGYEDTCAIKSQELILNATGVPISEDTLRQEAMEHGLYTPGKGTSMDDVGKLLELHGIRTEQHTAATMNEIADELSHGRPVIAGVDSGELWNPGFKENLEDLYNPHGADHALIVCGIEYDDVTHQSFVNVIDPGTGDFSHSYPLEQFEDALHDSGDFIVTLE